VLDDLSTGRRGLLPAAARFVEGDVADPAVADLLRGEAVEAVLHFAGSIVVPESVRDPLKYYDNNTGRSRALIAACLAASVRRFVFSSSAAVYGAADRNPIPEDAETRPVNPYGRSKLMTEQMLADVAAARPDFRWAALRYFNVAGADPGLRTGQTPPLSTHVIKVALEAAIGKRPFVEIYGTDWPTPDGTCLRDYVHVSDLADAHLAALAALGAGLASQPLNCGYGRGHSVREVIAAVEAAAGLKLDVRSGARRPGDPPVLVADPARLRRLLDWRPKRDSLDAIVRDALAWERRLLDRGPP
jgi:UDP-glucose 4-epimerase